MRTKKEKVVSRSLPRKASAKWGTATVALCPGSASPLQAVLPWQPLGNGGRPQGPLPSPAAYGCTGGTTCKITTVSEQFQESSVFSGVGFFHFCHDKSSARRTFQAAFALSVIQG